MYTCNSGLESNEKADGLPSNVEKATLPPRSGDMSEYSLVHRALVSAPRSVLVDSGRP